MGADTKANTWDGGALQGSNLCVLEDGGERGGALDSDVILPKTASEGRSGHVVEEQACQRALTQKRTLGRRRT